MNFVSKAKGLVTDFKQHWKTPAEGRYMPFKEIAAYAGGGIGAYFIIQLGSTLLVGTQNMIVGSAIGVAPTDMYILYLISTLVNIPLTAVRANMIDNTRNKAGKYRPYILSMGIPTALIAIAYVWFPYAKMYELFPGTAFGTYEKGYIIKCAMVLLFSLLLQFFYNFFNDAYTNLIHVLSPNTQERTDVLAVKSVVYSLAPSIMNFVGPLVADFVSDGKLLNIKVYRYTYPIYAVIGIGLIIIVYAHTQEKIVQAKTHTIQISFFDSLREVAKNKYFWIIACAGWLGFLESAYSQILSWSNTYGHTCSGKQLAIINLLIGNAALWGMLLAPICIKKWGKKKVLIGVNMLNVVFILSMIIDMRNIWWLFAFTYLNWLVGAFEQITTPAIQADIRDYQQYRSGERIDGMFAAVATIGNIVTLATSSVLPIVQKHYGVYEGNGYENPLDILDIEAGQHGLLYKLMGAMIIMAAAGAFMNVVPYFFYDLSEKRQKGIVRVLKIRALFEDYGNGILKDESLIEVVDIIKFARTQANETPLSTEKTYKRIKNKEERKKAKKEYKERLLFNEEIDISAFVCQELDKFSTPFYKTQLEINKAVYDAGLSGLLGQDMNAVKIELRNAKILPTKTEEEKEIRKFAIDIARKKLTSCKTIKKYYSGGEELKEPDFSVLDELFAQEDDCDEALRKLHLELADAKKEKNSDKVISLKVEIKAVSNRKKEILKAQKNEMDMHARYGRAAKPYLYAEKLTKQYENYTQLDDIMQKYDEAVAHIEKVLS